MEKTPGTLCVYISYKMHLDFGNVKNVYLRDNETGLSYEERLEGCMKKYNRMMLVGYRLFFGLLGFLSWV